MFCTQCGTENQTGAGFCQKCGKPLSGNAALPEVGAKAQRNESAIWNPNAAANWSLIFTPAFGSYLQMLNWRSLGEPEKSASSQNWFYASLGMLALYVLLNVFIVDPKTLDGVSRGPAFLFLLVWYFSAGREQSKYVKEKYGASYARKSWGKALLVGVGATIGYIILARVVTSMLIVARSA